MPIALHIIFNMQIKRTILMLCCILFGVVANAQTKAEISASKKLFAGNWIEKKTGRKLLIKYDNPWGMAEISDWHGNYYAEHAMIDIYKASVVKDKLVMHEDKTEHISPYSEIVRQGANLIYRTKDFNDAKGKFIERLVFVRRNHGD